MHSLPPNFKLKPTETFKENKYPSAIILLRVLKSCLDWMNPEGEYIEPQIAAKGDFQVCFVLLKQKTPPANLKPTTPCSTESFCKLLPWLFRTAGKLMSLEITTTFPPLYLSI